MQTGVPGTKNTSIPHDFLFTLIFYVAIRFYFQNKTDSVLKQ